MEGSHSEMATDLKKMPKDDPKMLEWEVNFKKTLSNTPNAM